MTTYDVNVTRDGKWWMVEVPAIGGLTQARRVTEVEDMARDLIAVTLDVPLSDVELGEVNLAVDDLSDLQKRVRHIAEISAEAASLQARALKEFQDTARALVDRKVPVRDVGALLGVSHQRIAQITKAETVETTRAIAKTLAAGAAGKRVETVVKNGQWVGKKQSGKTQRKADRA